MYSKQSDLCTNRIRRFPVRRAEWHIIDIVLDMTRSSIVALVLPVLFPFLLAFPHPTPIVALLPVASVRS